MWRKLNREGWEGAGVREAWGLEAGEELLPLGYKKKEFPNLPGTSTRESRGCLWISEEEERKKKKKKKRDPAAPGRWRTR